MNTLLFPISMMSLVILLLIFLLKRLRQPYMIAYILAGVLLGPYAGRLFTHAEDIASLGEIGILLLMFFLGMEMDIPDRRSLLLKPIIAQVAKMILSAGFAILLGTLLGLSVYNILLLAVLFIFNSTAVVSEYLSKNGALNTPFGKVILNVLLLQDVLLAPVLTLFQFLGKQDISMTRLLIGVIGSVVIFILLRAVRQRNLMRPAVLRDVEQDHELQVFLGSFLCLGFGLLAEAAGLSGAIGSFVAGMLIGRTQAFHWLEHALKPFRVFFVSFFFVSIGLRLDLPFIRANYPLVVGGTLLVLLSNSFLSSLVFRLLCYNWQQSLYGGALLSQTGEFGILACSLAYRMQIIDQELFKTGIAITALSLLISTTWIEVLRKLCGVSAR